MTTLFYRNFRLLILTILLILVWGMVAFFTLPRLEDPELVPRVAVVKTFFPGADAGRVEALVTERIEPELDEIEEIKSYESTSKAGSSIIKIELVDQVQQSEVDVIWARVRDRIRQAASQLPPGAMEPELEELEVRAYALIAALTWEQDNPPNYAILNRLAETLKDELAGLPGTEKVEIFGAPPEEITVEIDPIQLTTLGLTAEGLSNQIQQSDAKVSAGQFRSSQNNFSLEVESELDSLERIQTIPIRFGREGQFTQLGDIATVQKTILDPPNELALVEGHPGVSLAVFVESDYQLDQWARSAENQLTEFRQQLGKGVNLEVIFSQSPYVEARLRTLIVNLLLSGLLVFGVTLIMMGWKSALVVGLALPLSSCMVLGLMQQLGIPLHQMSVTGLIVALGLLIDTAIIVVDEVNHHLEAGVQPEIAITQTIQYLLLPLLASTITTILAFVPITALPGSAGEFVGTIGTSVILAVGSSLLISITVIVTLAAKLYQKSPGPVNPLVNPSVNRSSMTQPSWWNRGFSNAHLTQLYRASLKGLFKYPILGVLLGVILPIVGFSQIAGLPQQFFPLVDRDQLQIEFELPITTPIEQTKTLALQARELLLDHPEIQEVHWFLGRSAPRYFYNLTGGRERAANYGQGFVQLNLVAQSDFIQTLQTEVDTAFPQARMLVRQLEQGPPFEAPVELRIYGPDLDRLRALGEQSRKLLAQVPQVTHTRDSLGEVQPQIKLQIDEPEARLAGLDYGSISRQLDTFLEGNSGGSILETTEELPVRVRISNAQRRDMAQITSLDLAATASSLDQNRLSSIDTIPLSALGTVELQPESSSITRRNGQRFNLVQGFIDAGTLPSQVLSAWMQKQEAEVDLPPGYWLEIAGESENQADAQAGIVSTIPIVLAIAASVLILSLNSLRATLIIGGVAICSVGLGFFSLWLFGYPFGFMGIIGTFGLVGIAINDSVSVLAALQDDPEVAKGNRRATREVVIRSTRHVIATTLTTVVGFIPLVIAGGGFWPPLAVAIAGGVSGATLLALYFVPCCYLLLVNLSTGLKSLKLYR